MENVKRLPAGYRRDAPSPSTRDSGTARVLGFESNSNASHNVTQEQSPYFAPTSRLVAGLFDPHSPPEVERPLDSFDRALLEESARLHEPGGRLGLTRVSLPHKPLTPLMTSSTRRYLQDDLHDNSDLQASSSSPTAPATSPTVSFLKNRRSDRKNHVLPSKVSNPRPNTFSPDEGRPSFNMITGNMRANGRSSLANQPTTIPPVIQGIQLVPASTLPDQIRSVFKFGIFNAMQSKCFESAFHSDDNLVVSAPTGSGKTVIMELAICRLVVQSKGRDFKIVYQGPTKSLCSERYRDWHTKFSALSLHCAELTGDSDHSDLANAQKANIIITTPEKWDSVTRKWKDHAKLMQLVKLFLVDEVHILKDERGATLEAVVSRMKSLKSNVRVVALSATVPNSEDVAAWLGKDSTSQHLPARREVFGESFRPVELKKHVYGFEAKGNDFAFESMLTHQIPEIIERHGRGKPVMVFCSTRRASVTTAKVLADMWSTSHSLQRPWRGSGKQLPFTSSELKATTVAGVAFHHGGVSAEDRRSIENAFLDGLINVICCTSTLAVGVNLPCYLVILKGTKAWTDNGFKEYADLEVMQMLGRAGRPQFETSACAVILTRKDKVAHYEKMVSGEEMLESCLHQNLIEHLNAEVVLGTVYDVASAKQWLESTFFYVRLKKNPTHYQLREGVEESTRSELLDQLCKKDVALLMDAGLMEHSDRLTSTVFGEAMARYYVRFDTMKSFTQLPPKARMSEILSVLAQAKEFREVRMLAGEKSFYKEINKAPEIKFPIKVDIALPAHKISLLIQAELGNVALPDGETHKRHLQQSRIDKIPVFAHANRLIRCIIDCQIHLEDGISTRNALELGRSLAARVWDNTASQLRQVEGLGEVSVRKLASASINSIDTLLNTEPSRIELVLRKNPPFGYQLLQKLESFPNLRVSVKETNRELRFGDGVRLTMIAELGFLNKLLPHTFNKKMFSICFLAETSDGALVDFRRFSPRMLERDEQVCLTLHLTKPTSQVNCHVMCDNIAGTSKYAQLNLSDIPTSVYRNPRVQENMQHEPQNTGRHAGVSKFCNEEFDDGGVNDQDLLAFEADGAKIEVIEDIDDIVAEQIGQERTMPSKEILQQHRGANSGPAEDADVATHREPTRLPSGRWTCQHDCNEREKKCKHRCCKEGVAKPRRRQKVEPKIKDEEKVQKKITAVMKPKIKSEGKDPTQSADMTLPNVECMPDQTRATVSSTTRRSRSQSSGDTMRSSRGKHVAPARKRLKLSNCRDPEDSEHDYKDTDFKSENSQRLSHNSQSEILKEHITSTSKANEDFFAPFSDDDDDDAANFSIGEFGPVDELGSRSTISAEVVEDTKPSSTSHGDIDLGCFDAPLEHVAMSDILKKGKTSAATRNNFAMPELPDLAVEADFDDDFFLAPADFDGAPSNPPGNVDDSVSLQYEDITSFADTPVESVVKTPDGIEPMDVPIETENDVAETACKESDSQREKRLYEEDQKRKWEGIDQWIYDEFHDYVELV
ncbi:Sec63 Brl domain-containing protein [Cladophialophora immunda]|nr:Sec63 Brl domain-containing protein [Cladophialophora immunda]